MGALTRMNILGIDTSCDDTAAAIVTDGRQIRANLVRSQLREHAPHGGVVPEVASRAHLGDIASVTQEALTTAGMTLDDHRCRGRDVRSGTGRLADGRA